MESASEEDYNDYKRYDLCFNIRHKYNFYVYILFFEMESKKINNDEELIQSDPASCPQNQKGNN